MVVAVVQATVIAMFFLLLWDVYYSLKWPKFPILCLLSRGSPAKKRPLQGANYRVSLSLQLMKKPRVPGHHSASWERHPSYTLLSKPVLLLPAERTFAWQSIPSVLSCGNRNRLSPFRSWSGIFFSSFSPNKQLTAGHAGFLVHCLPRPKPLAYWAML